MADLLTKNDLMTRSRESTLTERNLISVRSGSTETDRLEVNDETILSGNLTVEGESTLNGDIALTGNFEASGDVSAATMETTGDVTVGGNLTVTNTVTAEQLTSTDDATVSGDLAADTVTTTTSVSSPSYITSGSQFHDRNYGLGEVYIPSSGGPDVVAVATGSTCMSFDAGTDEEIYFTTRLPNNYVNGTNVGIFVFWSASDTNTGNYIVGVDATLNEAGGGVSSVDTITTTVAGPGTADAWALTKIGDLTGTNYEGGDGISCRMYRDADNGSDTATGEFQLHHLVFYFRVDNLVRT